MPFASRLAALEDSVLRNQALQVFVHRLAGTGKFLRRKADNVGWMFREILNQEFPDRFSAGPDFGHFLSTI